jgi:hypothetical protein
MQSTLLTGTSRRVSPFTFMLNPFAWVLKFQTTVTGQALSIKFDDTPAFVPRPPRREGFASNSSPGGDLLSRISGVGAPSNGRDRNANEGNRGGRGGSDVPRGLTRGYRRGGPARYVLNRVCCVDLLRKLIDIPVAVDKASEADVQLNAKKPTWTILIRI